MYVKHIVKRQENGFCEWIVKPGAACLQEREEGKEGRSVVV